MNAGYAPFYGTAIYPDASRIRERIAPQPTHVAMLSPDEGRPDEKVQSSPSPRQGPEHCSQNEIQRIELALCQWS